MKKNKLSLLFLVAICALFLSSCAKEVEISPDKIPADTEQADDYIQIIGTIKDGELTKTEYDSETYRFSWSTDPANNLYDEIGLLVYKNNSSVNWYRIYADYAASSTTFSGYANIGDADTNPGEWSQTGFAIYPVQANTNGRTGFTRKDILTYGSTLVNGSVTVSLSSAYNLGADPDMNTQLACTPLVANRVGSTNEYEFRTAVGVLMITLDNVHTNVTALRVTSPSSNAPLSGTFLLESGKPDIAMANHTSSAAADQSRTINFTVSTAGTKTFYIPVPVGTIPLVEGKGLQIELLADEEIIFSRRYTKELTIVKNQIIPVTLDSEWKKLGTGKFIDNHLWGKMEFGTNTFDEVGAVDVVFYQNNYDRTQYRIANPYGQAASFLAAESKSQGDHDDYLFFTVPSEGNVTFTDHKTGYTVEGEIVTITHVDSEHNKIVAWSSANPAIIQLAPKYLGTNNYQESRQTYDNKVLIIFPDATTYGGSFSIVNDKADLSEGISYTKGSDAPTIGFLLTDYPIYSYFTAANSSQWSNLPGSRAKVSDNPFSATSLGFNNGPYGNSDHRNSGIKYLTWTTWDGNYLYMIGCKKFYAITTTDATNIVGTYKFENLYCLAAFDRSQWRDLTDNTDNRMVIAVSNDPSKGNVMITDLFGILSDGSVTNKNLTNTNGEGGTAGSVFELKANPEYIYKAFMDKTKFGAGNPVYGCLKSSDAKVYFENTATQTFFTYDDAEYTLRNYYASEKGFFFNYASTPSVSLTYGSSTLCIVPADASPNGSGVFDGARTLLTPSKSNANSQPSDASNIVGLKQQQ